MPRSLSQLQSALQSYDSDPVMNSYYTSASQLQSELNSVQARVNSATSTYNQIQGRISQLNQNISTANNEFRVITQNKATVESEINVRRDLIDKISESFNDYNSGWEEVPVAGDIANNNLANDN